MEGRSQSQAARLLKSLVVAGAYLGGSSCGGESRLVIDGAGRGGATGPGSAGGAGAGAGGAATAGYTGDIDGCPSSQRVCTCAYQPPLSISCTLDHPLGYLEGSSGGWVVVGITCECDRSRPAGPEACEYTQQFTCAEYAPEHEECTCVPDAPRSKADCREHYLFQCAGTDPEIGCQCVTPIR